MKLIHQPATSSRLGDYLKCNLQKDWEEFRAAIAFAKRSGTRHIFNELKRLAKGARIELLIGIDHHGTSAEALSDLMAAIQPNGRVIVFHNRLPFTFHPKLYFFRDQNSAELFVGSGNLTEGGLFTNYEANIHLCLDLKKNDSAALVKSVEDTLDEWSDFQFGTAHVLDQKLLESLVSRGLVMSEADLAIVKKSENRSSKDGDKEFPTDSLFAGHPVPGAPAASSVPKAVVVAVTTAETGQQKSLPEFSNFVMTLQKTDVGVGQTSAGTSRRSPEIFIPLSARNAHPGFWEWPDGFVEDASRPDKLDRVGVRMRLGTSVFSVNMMTWPVKHDFRLRSEALRSAGNVGDILHLEKMDESMNFDYFAQVIPTETSQHPEYLSRCTENVRNSQKRYGYF